MAELKTKRQTKEKKRKEEKGKNISLWRARNVLGEDKQRKLPFKMMSAFCLSCSNAFLALQHGGFVLHE